MNNILFIDLYKNDKIKSFTSDDNFVKMEFVNSFLEDFEIISNIINLVEIYSIKISYILKTYIMLRNHINTKKSGDKLIFNTFINF